MGAIKTRIRSVAIEAVLLLRTPHSFEISAEDWNGLQRELLDGRYSLELEDRGSYLPRITILPRARVPPSLRLFLPQPVLPNLNHVIRVLLQASARPEIYIEPDDGLTYRDAAALERSDVALSLENWMHQVLLAANIAHPGGLTAVGGAVVSKGRIQTYLGPTVPYPLVAARHFAKGRGWPIIDEFNVQTVWNWLAEQALLSDPPSVAVRQAVNALWNAVDAEGFVRLLWTVIGVESFYGCRPGAGSVTLQLRERIDAWLGRHADTHKLVSNVYSMRSRFVHGGSGVPGLFGGTYDDHVEREIERTCDAAMAILLASLQELIRRDWHRLQFTTDVKHA